MERQLHHLRYQDEIENYTIEHVLGAGGFGVTYKGLDQNLGCPVAIKEYFPTQFATRDTNQHTITPKSEGHSRSYRFGLQRFLDEARVLAKFKSSHIVRVSRYLECNNTAYIIMDYEDGTSLQDHLDEVKQLSEQELRNVAIPIMQGLITVHRNQYLHRDIKPANIYLRKNGSPVLLDFGSARLSLTDNSTPMTRVVTEGYAPFEQYNKREKQGPWTDLYGLGATLYHCISGTKPVDVLDRLSAKQHDEPDPLIPAIHMGKGFYQHDILQAIDKMLNLNVDERPQSIEDLIKIFSGNNKQKPEQTHTSASEPRSIIPEVSDYKWNKKEIEAIEQQLTHYMGPLSPVIMKKSLLNSSNIDELLSKISNAIEDPKHRQNFYNDIEKICSISVPRSIKSRITSGHSKTDVCLDLSTEFISTAEQRLAFHIGPLAKILVRNAMCEVNNLSDLLEILASEIPSPDERLIFINDLELQHAIMTTGF